MTSLKSYLAAVLGIGWRKRSREQQQLIARLEDVQSQLQENVRQARASELRLETLNRISGLLTQSLDLKQILRTAVDATGEAMDAEVSLIYFLNEGTGELSLVAHAGVTDEFVQASKRLLVGEGQIGMVARTGEILCVENASSDPRVDLPEAKRMKLQTVLIVPLKFKGKSVGVLMVAMRRHRQFLAEELSLLTLVANQIGAAMENARLFEEQRRIADALYLSERNYRDLFEKAHDAIWVHALDGTVTAANEADARLTGYGISDIVGTKVTRFLSPASLDLAREVRLKLLRDERFPQPYEQKIVRADGSEATVMMTSSLLTRDGQPVGFQHITRDVTEEKRMQDNLRNYVRQITKAQEEERKRIARELHDDTSQSLYAVARHIDNYLADRKGMADTDALFLRRLQEELGAVQAGVRRFSQDLRPAIIDDLGLLPALQWLTRETERTYGFRTELKVEGKERRFSNEAELMLFRIVQESLNNIGKHALAKEAEVNIELRQGKTIITVHDNGRGFRTPDNIGDLSRTGKLGLVGMQERVSLLGGILKVKSEVERGTTVTVEMPF